MIEQEELEAIMALDKETVDKLMALANLKQINANIDKMQRDQRYLRWQFVLAVFGAGIGLGGLLIAAGGLMARLWWGS